MSSVSFRETMSMLMRVRSFLVCLVLLSLLCADRVTLTEDRVEPKAATVPESGSDHWAFQRLRTVALPSVKQAEHLRQPIDWFIQSRLEDRGLSIGREADRRTLIRRLSLDLVGLPPSLDEIDAFLADDDAAAVERLVDRLLASPRYGERWGKYWLDAAGYADSNGYFNADTDRPLAFRYRDYVVRSFNADKPFDQFVREQIAGDELARLPNEASLEGTQQQIEWLEATHFLRNGPDGSGESDGNPDEVRADRYYALEASQQILMSSLFGLTIQCAKCHDHKFEPLSQSEYYQLQAILYPAFNIEQWKKPNERTVFVSLPGELARWQANNEQIDAEVAAIRNEFQQWQQKSRPRAAILFEDNFDGPPQSLAERWSNTAPGDDGPGGTAVVAINESATGPLDQTVPSAAQRNGVLHIVEGGAGGDKWLVTKTAFDWTPEKPGDWIQATFHLVARKLDSNGTPAARVALFIAAHDFNDNSQTRGGNILIDGNPDGRATVFVDYPGDDQQSVGAIGKNGWLEGHQLGVRITNIDNKKFRLEQLVDWQAEQPALEFTAEQLPNGAFGFEYCCGRSFIVDNVLIEGSQGRSDATPEEQTALREFLTQLDQKRKEMDRRVSACEARRKQKPGSIAVTRDLAANIPVVPLLTRGNPMTPGQPVSPGVPAILIESSNTFAADSVAQERHSTGRRLALANWSTKLDSRAAALLARVQVNRLWQHHFGRGLVSTPENLGESGATPSHPELLEWLTAEFVRGNWSLKTLHRLIVTSAVYRQQSSIDSSADTNPAMTALIQQRDPDNVLLGRFPLRRLDAEALRDSLLAVSGELREELGGPYIPTTRNGAGETIVAEDHPGALRRTIYLQQRRTQVLSFLNLFDAPSLVFNCTQRPETTMPLQSLTFLNSDFMQARAQAFAQRSASVAEITTDAERDTEQAETKRLQRLFVSATGRAATASEVTAASEFLKAQATEYGGTAEAIERSWNELAQMIFASNAFLYVE